LGGLEIEGGFIGGGDAGEMAIEFEVDSND
jgi:hypothetical protein